MSGGEFNYIHHNLFDTAEAVEEIIKESTNSYNTNTLDKFKETAKLLKKVGKMIERVDWLVSGDDGEHTFKTRWIAEGLEKLNQEEHF